MVGLRGLGSKATGILFGVRDFASDVVGVAADRLGVRDLLSVDPGVTFGCRVLDSGFVGVAENMLGVRDLVSVLIGVATDLFGVRDRLSVVIVIDESLSSRRLGGVSGDDWGLECRRLAVRGDSIKLLALVPIS